MIQAYDQYKHRSGNLKLVICGKMAWKNNALRNLIRKVDCADDIILTGYLQTNQVASLMASAKAFILPSLFEGFGIPILEAMQCGVPVITTANSAMSEVAGKDNARFIDPYSISSIANALLDVEFNQDKNQLHSARGIQRAKDFSWDKSIEIIESKLLSS